jgi:competence protein ComEA
MTINLFGKEITIKTGNVVLGGILLACILGISGYILSRNSPAMVINESESAHPQKTAKPGGNTAKELPKIDSGKQEDAIKIHIVGCVKKQGIVTIKKGQLIDDAIKAAGGPTPDADLYNINLVYALNQNTKLYIKSKKQKPSGGSTAASSSTQAPEAGTGVKVATDSEGAVVGGESGSGAGSGTGNNKVNINTATAAQLDTLPGVGEVTAQHIIEYREQNHGFKKLEELMNVPRIGDSLFNKMKELISLG